MAPEPPTILALVPNLFFLTRLREAAAPLSLAVVAVRQAGELTARATALHPVLVVIDMATPGQDWAAAITALRAEAALADLPIVAFGPHVDTASQAAARAAGASRVLANSRFVESLPALLASYAAGPSEGTEREG